MSQHNANTTSMERRPLAARARLVIALALAGSLPLGCASNATTASAKAPVIERIEPIVLVETTCPITGEVVGENGEVAYFESYAVLCKDRASARQLASLEPRQRARFAAEQVLAQKGIANETCPITGERLTATAAPVVFEGVVIGFATPADANQFRSLPEGRRVRLIEEWRVAESGATTES